MRSEPATPDILPSGHRQPLCVTKRAGLTVAAQSACGLPLAALDVMIAEATVDCYNGSECVTGFPTMIDGHLEVPFQTAVLGVDVTVTGIELADDEQIVAICARSRW